MDRINQKTAAAIMSCSPNGVSYRKQTGKIKDVVVDPNGHPMYNRTEIEELARQYRGEARAAEQTQNENNADCKIQILFFVSPDRLGKVVALLKREGVGGIEIG